MPAYINIFSNKKTDIKIKKVTGLKKIHYQNNKIEEIDTTYMILLTYGLKLLQKCVYII